MFWETVISYVVTLLGGLLLGVAFSKVAELGLCNIMDKQINYRIYVDGASALTAARFICSDLFSHPAQFSVPDPEE